jgi:hypothetical protein
MNNKIFIKLINIMVYLDTFADLYSNNYNALDKKKVLILKWYIIQLNAYPVPTEYQTDWVVNPTGMQLTATGGCMSRLKRLEGVKRVRAIIVMQICQTEIDLISCGSSISNRNPILIRTTLVLHYYKEKTRSCLDHMIENPD